MKNETSGRTILIVDNDAERRQLLRSCLQNDTAFTYSFIEQNTIPEMLTFLLDAKVHAIFMAEQLAEMSALQWLTANHATKNSLKIPIIITLAAEQDSTVRALLQAGASFCVSVSQTTPLLLQQFLHCTLTLNEQSFAAHRNEWLERPGEQIEERLQLAFETARMGYWEWDIQADRVRWRYQAEKMFGVQNEKTTGSMNGILALIHPADRDHVAQTLHSSIANGTDYKFEFRVQNEEQGTRWLTGEGRIFFNQSGQATLMIGVIRDVTERITAALALSASQRLNQAILDSLPEHIAVLDKNGTIVAINKAWQNFAQKNGVSFAAMQSTVGTNYLEVCETTVGEYSKEAKTVSTGIRSVLAGSTEHFRLEYPCHTPVEEHWFLMQATPLIHVGGGVVVSQLEITERRKIEAQLAALLSTAHSAKEIAERANRAKDEFIAQVTHDLRAPLSAVLGWAKVLKNKQVTEEIRVEAIQTIAESAEKQTHLIEDLLDISRMATGKLRLDIRPVSLSAVIRSAMDVMQPACDAKGISCTTELATDADDVTVDPARLEQVIWNLVSNAVKLTPNKGEVKVRLERADPYVRITVSDTGCGIRTEHLPFIFDRYWQSDASSGHRKGGLGLGLSLVRHIVELHGGTVSVSSAGENQGATFTVNLPYRAVRLPNKEEAVQLASESNQTEDNSFPEPLLSSVAFQGLTVVVVDDEPSARELVAEILRQHGAEVLKADSAQAAFDIITQLDRVPDLLVSDISMPEEDGYMLIRKIRRLLPEQGGAIPAIALTAFGRMEDRIRALSAGFQMHLPKPVEPAELALVAANLTNREIKILV